MTSNRWTERRRQLRTPPVCKKTEKTYHQIHGTPGQTAQAWIRWENDPFLLGNNYDVEFPLSVITLNQHYAGNSYSIEGSYLQVDWIWDPIPNDWQLFVSAYSGGTFVGGLGTEALPIQVGWKGWFVYYQGAAGAPLTPFAARITR